MALPSFHLACSMSIIMAMSTLHCQSRRGALVDESRVARLLVPDLRVNQDELSELLLPDTSEVRYRSATAADEQVFARIIPGLLSLSATGAGDTAASAGDTLASVETRMEDWNGLAHRIGYALERWQVDDDRYAVLRELPQHRRGRGTYIVRIAATADDGDQPTLILQAPHVYFDVGTGDLAIELFFASPDRGSIRALYMNSLHRYQTAPGEKKERKRNPADVCHNRRHLFATATRLAAEHVSPLAVIQLHGFDARIDDDDHEVDVIVSAETTARTDAVATALEKQFKKREIRRYPDQVAELGGEDNVQRKILTGYDDTRFAHIEMSREFRRYLRKRDKRRHRLAAALVSSMTGKGAGSSQ